jgi:UDP-glucose/galactose:(glucosyl)LPS alpha-1,2-glucosyl/galactosyltransferase
MLSSLGAANPGRNVTVHFLYDDRISDRDRSSLEAIVKGAGAEWNAVAVSRDATTRFPYTSRYGYSAWYRILLPNLLPGIGRVLYLDSDLLILDDLQALYDIELGDYYLAAVTQPTLAQVLPRLRDTLGLPDADSYFNSGVMTLDLGRLRSTDTVAQVLAFINERRGPMPWADQDPLNAALHDHRFHLSPRWNLMTPVFELPASMMPWSEADIRAAIADPAVIHFIGEHKPWHYRCRHPYRGRYFEFLAETPWKGKPIEGRTLRNIAIRPLPPRWQAPVDSTLDKGLHKARRILGRPS